ncbi:hypothetical protein F4677DRAFT_449551 [Hypoxylon crocopeplum]|nr:hypothetical protein F4677DRAFT_449551 [Hypoxylon crocopeplum]
MDQRVKNRRFHRKSRKGCLECKRRHIKCDERRPICGNCDVATLACCYAYQSLSPNAQSPSQPSPGELDLTSPDFHEPSATTGRWSHNPDCDDSFTLQHLGLFHHVETGMADWLMVTQSMEPMAQTYITSALSTPYLMNQLLALSAQHLSTLRWAQEEADAYRDLATQLQTRALRTFSRTKDDMSEQNVVARFLFSSLMAVQVLAQKLSASQDDFEQYMDGVIEYMEVQRGARIIGDNSWTILQRSILGEWIAHIEALERSDDATPPSDLSGPYTMLQSSEMDRESVEACLGAVQALSFVHHRLNMINTWGIHAPMAWATFISGDYIQLLKDRRPEALVILAHFSLYLHRCRDFWAFGDAGEYLIREICEDIGAGWTDWLSVPLSVLSELTWKRD